MFERFSDRARRAVVTAQVEARTLNHNYIGPEHILLGIIDGGDGIALEALQSMGIRLEAVRASVEEIIGVGTAEPSGSIPFTPRAKKVLELSLREALQLGHNYIGDEHILLGLISEGDSVAAQVLIEQGAYLNKVRTQVSRLANQYGPDPASRETGPVRAAPRPPRPRPSDITSKRRNMEERLVRIERQLGIEAAAEPLEGNERDTDLGPDEAGRAEAVAGGPEGTAGSAGQPAGTPEGAAGSAGQPAGTPEGAAGNADDAADDSGEATDS